MIVAEKSGSIKDAAFFSILELHGMKFSESEKNKLMKAHSRAGKISFAEAL